MRRRRSLTKKVTFYAYRSFLCLPQLNVAVPFYAYQQTEWTDTASLFMLIIGLTRRPILCLSAGEMLFYAYHGVEKTSNRFISKRPLFFERSVWKEKNWREFVKVSF